MNKETPSPIHLTSLQALRGIAAFLVVIYHTAGHERQFLPESGKADLGLLKGFWDLGFIGVDLFFVISGFVMIYVTRTYSSDFSTVFKFLRARFARIYPLWWVFCAVFPIYYWTVMPGSPIPYHLENSSEIVPHVIKSFLLIPQSIHPLLVIGWTLIHEVYFYIVFAGLLFLPKKAMPWALGFWAILIAIMAAMKFDTASISILLAPISSPYTLEFIAGACVGLLMSARVYKFAKIAAIFGMLTFFLFFIFEGETIDLMKAWGRVTVFALPCAVLLYGLSAMEIMGRIKSPIWLQRLGDWSYSLYLSHLPVLLAVTIIYMKATPALPKGLSDKLSLGSAGALDNIVYAAIAITACLVFAGFAYYFIERPLLKLTRKALKC